jgi:quinoprotein glucose dehydrogenase
MITAMCGSASAQPPHAGWPTYGGDPGGQRYSTAQQINRTDVNRLHQVWVYHTHALDSRISGSYSASFETTPILFHNLLYLSTPLDDIIALDPSTGSERWHFHPSQEPLPEGGPTTSRGVAAWEGGGSDRCSSRIFIGTDDAQLIAVDAASGKPCEDFGRRGAISLKTGLSGLASQFRVTSAPTVLGNIVVVGSSIGDNSAVTMAAGTVRAFDARTGRLVWTWDPIPWSAAQNPSTGAANTWSTIAADPDLGLFYLPTGSASPDYYGGMRRGDNRDANSIVALEATTGRKVWAFQVVHHDLWDYDVASEPLLFTWHGNVPAIAVTTKMGMVFVLDRRTGKPIFPLEEKPAPNSDIKGERTSPTEPMSDLASLSPLLMPTDGASPSRDESDQDLCRRQMSHLRYQGIYTPPSLKGSLIFPGAIGGINWGSAAYDPVGGILYANTNRLPYFVQLIPQKTLREIEIDSIFASTPILALFVWAGLISFLLWRERRKTNKPARLAVGLLLVSAAGLTFGIFERRVMGQLYEASQRNRAKTPGQLRGQALQAVFGDDHSPQYFTPYALYRHPILDTHGNPCSPEPWGTVSALNLQTGKTAWEVPHGTQIPGRQTGALSLGGLIVTAGGLVFSAGTREPLLRAYDSESGRELWQGSLPVPAQSTPMTYEIGGKQFVVIAAGGHGVWGTPQGDSVVAFSLPSPRGGR